MCKDLGNFTKFLGLEMGLKTLVGSLGKVVSLPAKSTRDAIGISSYERGAAWAALMLRLIAAETTGFTNAVRVTADFAKSETTSRSLPGGGNLTIVTPTPIFQFQAALPYSRDAAMRFGGNWIGSVIPFSQADCPATGISFPRSGFPTIGIEPSWVDSLERYLSWCCWKLHSQMTGLKQQDPNYKPRNDMAIRFLDEAAYPSLQINGQISFDLDEYYAYGSIVAAISPGPGTTVNIGGGTGASPEGGVGGESGTGFRLRTVSGSLSEFGDLYQAGDLALAGDL